MAGSTLTPSSKTIGDGSLSRLGKKTDALERNAFKRNRISLSKPLFHRMMWARKVCNFSASCSNGSRR
ncbi:hypothetical protein MPC4_300043 [Methylocella tundrae]|uniref:Uncharacterized protein n=1 Tax=Methylocella tundrae TaxID=227605 RepID=A0A8B6M7W6_METTU|nr:hypothetical protein MPC1_330002 [Methylocella tundrae]VTZ51123.1 hypothetical protein MPC4_300043 [Methylocella tundrae]